MYNYTYLCGWITSAIIVSPMPLIRTCIVGFVRIFPTDFGRSLRRWVLMSNAQVLRGRSVCLVMLDQRIVDLACVIAILRQTSYKQGKSNPAESTVSHAGTKLAIMQLRSPTPNAPYSFMQIIQELRSFRHLHGEHCSSCSLDWVMYYYLCSWGWRKTTKDMTMTLTMTLPMTSL